MSVSLGFPNHLLSVSWLDLAGSPSDSPLLFVMSFLSHDRMASSTTSNEFGHLLAASIAGLQLTVLDLELKSSYNLGYRQYLITFRKKCDHDTENVNFSKSKLQLT